MKKYLTTKNIVIACLILIIIGLLIFIVWDRNQNTNNNLNTNQENYVADDFYLVISINPKLMLRINEDTIKNIYQLNEDAYIYTNEDLQGLSLEEGLKKVSEIAKDNNYLKEDTEVSLSYYNGTPSKETIKKVEKAFNDLGIKTTQTNISDVENKEILDIINSENKTEDEKEETENVKDTSSSNNSGSQNQKPNSNSNNNSSNNNNWTNEGTDIYYNEPESGSCTYSMRGVNFVTPSWFTLYEGDRWATQKEYNRVNPASDLAVYIRENYNGYDSIEGNDGIHSYYGTFLQFLPDDINCMKNRCDKGDLECYEELNYIERSRLTEEKGELQANEDLIRNYEAHIKEQQEWIKDAEDNIKTYCSEMTSETEKCVYRIEGSNMTTTWWSTIAEQKANIERYKQNIKSAEISIEQTKREVHYKKLRVYQQQTIYDYVKETFPVFNN